MNTTANQTPNPLLECANQIFQLIAVITVPAEFKPEPNFREKILDAFTHFERSAFSRKISSIDIQQSKYALCAFVDEAVLGSNWEGRNQWLTKSLQLEFFGEHLAGEGFFKRVNELRQQIMQNLYVIEVYYICMQLGFAGMYRLRGFEALLALQTDLRQQIAMVRGIIPAQLADDVLAKTSLATRVGQRLPLWVIIAVTLATVFLIYLGFTIAIDHATNIALQQLTATRTQLLQLLTQTKF